jgi:thymidylate kinase
MFIALYGINNIGKSTQVTALAELLEKHGNKVKTLKFPIYDLEPTGPQIDFFLRDPEAPEITGESFQMLYIQNRLDFEPTLNELLKEYDVVLAEDYIGTGMAWGMTQGVPYEWLQGRNMQHPQKKADLEILLDGERFLAGKEEQHRNESDDEAIQETRKHFQWLSNRYKWPLVNAAQEKEKVTHDLWNVVISRFPDLVKEIPEAS